MDVHEQFSARDTPQHRVRPVLCAWALHAAALIDDEAPGFLSALIRSTGVRRHVTLAVLAVSLGELVDNLPLRIHCAQQRAALKALGQGLREVKPRAALEAAFGLSNFEGLGTFERLIEPLAPHHYIRLVKILSDPREGRRRQVLLHTPRLDAGRLSGILALDASLCTVRIAKKVRTEEKAHIINDVVALVRDHRPDLTDDQLWQFCGQADQYAPFSEQVERLVSLIDDLGPPPFIVPADFQYLRHRREFVQIGREYRNCLESKWLTALGRQASFLLLRSRPAIAILVPTNQGWALGKVHCPRNSPPPPDVVEDVRAKLAAAGVGLITPAPVDARLASLRHALLPWDPYSLNADEWDVCVPGLD